MSRSDIQEAIQGLAKMAELEIAVSRFYATCGERWDIDGSIWARLAAMEVQHAVNIRKIADIVKKKPGKFKIVRFVNISGMDAILSRLQHQTKRVDENLVTQKEAVLIAGDAENSLLEMLYTKIFETDDTEYQELISAIVAETVDHRDFFNQEAESLRTKKAAPPPPPADTPNDDGDDAA
jgi:hypothetical protein